jgi:hypothetical protein
LKSSHLLLQWWNRRREAATKLREIRITNPLHIWPRMYSRLTISYNWIHPKHLLRHHLRKISRSCIRGIISVRRMAKTGFSFRCSLLPRRLFQQSL